MIVSAKPNRSNRRWSQVCVLVGALVVLPLGLASAQDYEAVGKRLKESVMKGEITERQADAMMDALKKETGKTGKKDAARSPSSADLEVIWEKLQAKVRAGELTKEQAPITLFSPMVTPWQMTTLVLIQTLGSSFTGAVGTSLTGKNRRSAER